MSYETMTFAQALSLVLELAINTHRENITLTIGGNITLAQSDEVVACGRAITMIEELVRDLPVYGTPHGEPL